jgi:hypothetical protein
MYSGWDVTLRSDIDIIAAWKTTPSVLAIAFLVYDILGSRMKRYQIFASHFSSMLLSECILFI